MSVISVSATSRISKKGQALTPAVANRTVPELFSTPAALPSPILRRVSSPSTSGAAPLQPWLRGARSEPPRAGRVRAQPRGAYRRQVALRYSGGRAPEVPAEMPFEIPIRRSLDETYLRLKGQ